MAPRYTLNEKSALTHKEMKAYLLDTFGLQCWGCDFIAKDERYLQLDHVDPKADRGSNHLDNRALLCQPCNHAKSNRITISELRRRNTQEGHLTKLLGDPKRAGRSPHQPASSQAELPGGAGKTPEEPAPTNGAADADNNLQKNFGGSMDAKLEAKFKARMKNDFLTEKDRQAAISERFEEVVQELIEAAGMQYQPHPKINNKKPDGVIHHDRGRTYIEAVCAQGPEQFREKKGEVDLCQTGVTQTH